MSKPLTRKELADLTNLSPRQIARNEKKLGLDAARVNVNSRVILYNSRLSLAILRAHGFQLAELV